MSIKGHRVVLNEWVQRKGSYMKKAACTICLLLISGCLGRGKDHYAVLGGGYGGKTDSANFTVEGVKIARSQGRDSLFGLGYTAIFNGGDVPSDTLDYPCPHWDYTDLGVERDLPEMGIIGKYGIEIVKDTGLFATVVGGITFADETEIAQSNVTGWYYEQDTGINTYGLFGGGVSYFMKEDLFMQAEYDNRRGITIGAGWRF